MRRPRSRRVAKKRSLLLDRIARSDLQPGDVLVIRVHEDVPPEVLRQASRMLWLAPLPALVLVLFGGMDEPVSLGALTFQLDVSGSMLLIAAALGCRPCRYRNVS